MVFISGSLCGRCTTAQVLGSDQSIASICDVLVDMLHHVVVELFVRHVMEYCEVGKPHSRAMPSSGVCERRACTNLSDGEKSTCRTWHESTSLSAADHCAEGW